MATKSSKSNKSSKSSNASAGKGAAKTATATAAAAQAGFKPGTFCWIELTTRDGAGAKRFYTELFGWTANEMPMPDGGTYAMMQLGGKDVGGLWEDAQQHPNWLSYVSVKDADAAAQKAAASGGKVVKPAFDVMDAGRMAVLQDPTGATFAVWQAKKHVGAGVADNRPGSCGWNELLTNNVDRSGKFFTQLFGWRAEFQQMGPMQYTTFWNGERRAGGMMAIAKEWGNVPPNWTVYFSVADCDATAKKAQSLGAKVLAPPMDIPQVGRFATLQDPQGAAFSIIKFSM